MPIPPASPFVEISRDAWSDLAARAPLPLSADDVARLSALGDPIDLAEVDTIYRPLTSLLEMYVSAMGALHEVTHNFLQNGTARTPYVIGVAGSVAVGKSTTSRLLRELLSRYPSTPNVQLVTTDGFLLPNAELERRGLMGRKGFPESFDRRALLRFVEQVKSGVPSVKAPVYSHLFYDIVPGRHIEVKSPDVLIVEGLNVLQQPRRNARNPLVVSDFFDFSIYVDAEIADNKAWYIERFMRLQETAFRNDASYFRRYADLTREQAIDTASTIWDSINAPNLHENILPTRGRATLVLKKGGDHRIESVRLRKI